jgi:HPt (histidine-containing phosphotransfer) domain-containing protein
MPRSSQSGRPASKTAPKKAARNEILDELRAALDEADLRVILTVFKADVEAQLNDLGDFAGAGKHEAVRRIAHRLAGLLAQFGAGDASELAHRLAASTSNPGDARAVAALAGSSRKAIVEICGPVATISNRQPAAKRPATRRRAEIAPSA